MSQGTRMSHVTWMSHVTYVRVCVCIYIYAYMRLHIHICMCMCACVFVYTYMRLYIHICICVYMYSSMPNWGSSKVYLGLNKSSAPIFGVNHATIVVDFGCTHIWQEYMTSQSPPQLWRGSHCKTLQHTATHCNTHSNRNHSVFLAESPTQWVMSPSDVSLLWFCPTVPVQHTAAHWKTNQNPVTEIILRISNTMGLVPILWVSFAISTLHYLFNFSFSPLSHLLEREIFFISPFLDTPFSFPPKNGLIALWSATNGRVSTF